MKLSDLFAKKVITAGPRETLASVAARHLTSTECHDFVRPFGEPVPTEDMDEHC